MCCNYKRATVVLQNAFFSSLGKFEHFANNPLFNSSSSVDDGKQFQPTVLSGKTLKKIFPQQGKLEVTQPHFHKKCLHLNLKSQRCAVPAEDCKSQLKTRKRLRRAGGGWLRLRHGDSRSPTNWKMETRAQEHEFTNTQPEETQCLVFRAIATRSSALSKNTNH